MIMRELLSDELLSDEIFAGQTRRNTKYRIKRRKRMDSQTKSLKKRQTNLSQRRKDRKKYKDKSKTDSNFKKNRKDYRKQYYKKNKKGSIGFALPFELEFLYMGKPSYLMSLSEMFAAINIYVEGETAIVVGLNDFLNNTEWYGEEDFYLFMGLIDESYAVLDEDTQDAGAEFTLDERDPPAKRHIDKSASMKDLKLIYRESSSLDEDEIEEYGKNAFSKYHYYMPLEKDFFYHYTYAERVSAILEDGYLRPNFIMDKDAPSASGIYAISGVWGWNVPSVQVSGGKKKRIKDMVALKFETTTQPKIGFPEEVVWDKPVKLKNASVISIKEARTQLRGKKESFIRTLGNHSEPVVYYNPREAFTEKSKLKRMKKSSGVCNSSLLQMLLAILRGAHFAHWTSHWQVKGTNFYGDHEMMDRIYNTLIEEIDTLAEKIVSTYGGDAVNMVEQAQIIANQLLPLVDAHSMNDPIRRALLIEEGLQVVFKNIYALLTRPGGLSLGMDDFLMSIANAHETNLYLLRQRCSGVREDQDIRVAFNKYNAPDLIGQLLKVLNQNGLEDTVSELKSMKVPQIVDKAWTDARK
jgi:DNA-binding ferritin-like protein